MTRLPLTICLALAWFFAVNALLSIAVAGATAWWRVPARRVRRRGSADTRQGAALCMRLLPSLAAVAFVAGVFVPAFVLHEPARGPEAVGWMVRAAAAAASSWRSPRVARGLAAVRRTRALVDGWMSHAAPIQLDAQVPRGGGRVRHRGLRFRWLRSSACALRACSSRVRCWRRSRPVRCAPPWRTSSRIVRAWDNAKRLLVCWTPGLLAWSAAGRQLESRWAAGAECAADRSAADSPTRGLDLAGALVKVSRLAIAPVPGVRLFSTLHGHGDVADRVSRAARPGARLPPLIPRQNLCGDDCRGLLGRVAAPGAQGGARSHRVVPAAAPMRARGTQFGCHTAHRHSQFLTIQAPRELYNA